MKFFELMKEIKKMNDIEKKANGLKKLLFEQIKKTTITTLPSPYDLEKKYLIYMHNFLGDIEVGIIIEDYIQSLKKNIEK